MQSCAETRRATHGAVARDAKRPDVHITKALRPRKLGSNAGANCSVHMPPRERMPQGGSKNAPRRRGRCNRLWSERMRSSQPMEALELMERPERMGSRQPGRRNL